MKTKKIGNGLIIKDYEKGYIEIIETNETGFIFASIEVSLDELPELIKALQEIQNTALSQTKGI